MKERQLQTVSVKFKLGLENTKQKQRMGKLGTNTLCDEQEEIPQGLAGDITVTWKRQYQNSEVYRKEGIQAEEA